MNTLVYSIGQARAAKEKAKQRLSNLGIVVGIGIVRIGDGYGVKVNLSNEPPSAVNLPNAIDGVPVRFEVVGTIRKTAP